MCVISLKITFQLDILLVNKLKMFRNKNIPCILSGISSNHFNWKYKIQVKCSSSNGWLINSL